MTVWFIFEKKTKKYFATAEKETDNLQKHIQPKDKYTTVVFCNIG